MSPLTPDGIRALRSYFDDRDGVMRSLLENAKKHEAAIAHVREALEAIASPEDHTPRELGLKATKALEKLNGDLA